jgi:hypothetical protein
MSRAPFRRRVRRHARVGFVGQWRRTEARKLYSAMALSYLCLVTQAAATRTRARRNSFMAKRIVEFGTLATPAARSVPIPAWWPAHVWPHSRDGRPNADVSYTLAQPASVGSTESASFRATHWPRTATRQPPGPRWIRVSEYGSFADRSIASLAACIARWPPIALSPERFDASIL